MLMLTGAAGLALAYSNATQNIHVSKSCPADGYCVNANEMYITRDNPALPATVRVDYTANARTWDITITNIENVTVDAQQNYFNRGAATFFVDITTDYWTWLVNQGQETVHLSSDVVVSFRLVNVPTPEFVKVDGADWGFWLQMADGVLVLDVPSGTHTILFLMPRAQNSDSLLIFGFVMFLLLLAVGLYTRVYAILILDGLVGLFLGVAIALQSYTTEGQLTGFLVAVAGLVILVLAIRVLAESRMEVRA